MGCRLWDEKRTGFRHSGSPAQAVDVNGRGWTFWRRWAVCGVASILLCGGYVGLVLDPHNRLYMFYGWMDTAALVLLVFAPSLALAVLLHAAARVSGGRSDRWLSPGFYFLAVLIGFNLFPELRLKLVPWVPWLSGWIYYLIIWGVGLVATAGGCRWSRMRKTATAGWHYLFYLWPVMPILLFSLFTAPHREKPSDLPSQAGKRTAGEGAPVVVLILDMIGYDDLFAADGRVRDELPHLADFAGTATVFHRARSPGDETGTSLPGLLLQEEVGIVSLKGGGAKWASLDSPGEGHRPAEQFDRSLPHAFKRWGYRRMFIGYYLPYQELMPSAFDRVCTCSCYGAAWPGREGTPLGEALLHQAVRFVSESKDPISAVVKQVGLQLRYSKSYFRKITGEIHSEGVRYLEGSLSPGDFAVLHLTVPHNPFVFDAGGGDSRFGYLDPAGYPGQLRYADRLFGEWIGALKKSGLWERSWVVMLSDHGPHFRDYLGSVDGKRHVPFLVKAPGQTVRQDLREPIRLVDFEKIPGFPFLALREDVQSSPAEGF